jgi:hypothetical protein
MSLEFTLLLHSNAHTIKEGAATQDREHVKARTSVNELPVTSAGESDFEDISELELDLTELEDNYKDWEAERD